MKSTRKFSYIFTLLVLLSGSFFNAKGESAESAEDRENNNFKINSTEIEKLNVLRAQKQEEFNSRQQAINEKRESGISNQITKKEQDILTTDRRKFHLKSEIAFIEIALKNENISEDKRSKLIDKLDVLRQAQQDMQNGNKDQG